MRKQVANKTSKPVPDSYYRRHASRLIGLRPDPEHKQYRRRPMALIDQVNEKIAWGRTTAIGAQAINVGHVSAHTVA